MKRLTASALAIGLLAVLLAPGCSSAGSTKPLLTVETAAGARAFSLADLGRLPLVTVTAAGKKQLGPTLASVVEAAGASSYTSVTIRGVGDPVTLTRAQITPDVVLDFTNRGTVKLASPGIAKERWVKDISTIEVR